MELNPSRNSPKMQIETVMKTNALSFKPMSPCLRLFIQSLLAGQGTEAMFEELPLADDAIVGSAAFASSAPLGEVLSSATSLMLTVIADMRQSLQHPPG